MGESQWGILEVWDGRDRIAGCPNPLLQCCAWGVPLCPSPHAPVVCSETHEAPSLIHVCVWMNTQTLIRRSAHITFAYSLAWEKCSCIFSTSFFVLNPILDQEIRWTDTIRFDFLPSHSFSKSQRPNKYVYNSFSLSHFVVYKDLPVDLQLILILHWGKRNNRHYGILNCYHFPEDLTSPSRNHPPGKRWDTRPL